MANLIRNEFILYSNSEEFKLVLLENDFDDYLNSFLVPGRNLDNKQKLNAFTAMLNKLLYHWLDSSKNSSNYKSIQTYINKFIKEILIDFIKWSKGLQDTNKIVESLKKFSPITIETVEEIERSINLKESQILIPNIEHENSNLETNCDSNMKVDYAIITALEEDEMEKTIQLFVKEYEVENTINYIEFGHLKDNPKKKVVYASQHNTGMVDAAILASEILIRFKPKYLIMTGVLGGKPNETNIGDVIIATKVFEIDKGKITETGFKKETSVSSIMSKEIKKIHRSKKEIELFIDSKDETRSSNVKLHFGPIACVNQVIDIEGFFESKITEIDRKAIALEMESFAIVRACELVNDGKTVPIIIKSVMDNTQQKVDNSKPYASWTSARTLEYILKTEII